MKGLTLKLVPGLEYLVEITQSLVEFYPTAPL